MNITRENYEIYFIDHFDGKLDAAQTAELLLFLDANPDLKEEFESFSNLPLDIIEEEFEGKAGLIRGEVNASNADHYLIAELEGDITAAEKESLNRFLKERPEFEKDRKLFALTRLTAQAEVFPGKAALRQAIPMRGFFHGPVRYAVAAAIVLMLMSGAYLIVTNNQKDAGVQLAQEQPIQNVESQENNGPVTESPVVASENPDSANSTVNDNTTSKISPAPLRKKSAKKIPASSVPVAHVPQTQKREEAPEEVMPVAMPEEKPLLASAAPESTVPAQQQGASAQQYSAQSMTVLEALRKKAEEEIAKTTGTTSSEREFASVEGKSGKVKVLGLISKGIQKVGGSKVSLSTAYDVDGEMMAYDFKAGGITIQKK